MTALESDCVFVLLTMLTRSSRICFYLFFFQNFTNGFSQHNTEVLSYVLYGITELQFCLPDVIWDRINVLELVQNSAALQNIAAQTFQSNFRVLIFNRIICCTTGQSLSFLSLENHAASLCGSHVAAHEWEEGDLELPAWIYHHAQT